MNHAVGNATKNEVELYVKGKISTIGYVENIILFGANKMDVIRDAKTSMEGRGGFQFKI